MIRFFRSIRSRLAGEKKFSAYLIYAAGEILLVVIGILIALAINNANQRRLIRDKEQTYLAGLSEEFVSSRAKLLELINVNRRNHQGAARMISFFSDGVRKPDEKEFSELLYSTFAFDVAFNPNNSLLNEMISSGSLKDISDAELRKRLANWISTLEDISRQEADQDRQRERVLDLFRTDEYSLRMVLDLTGVTAHEIGLPARQSRFSNLSLLDSREFENNLLMFILTSRATESAHYLPLLEDIDAILLLIDRSERK